MLQSVVGPPVGVGLTEMKAPSNKPMERDFRSSVPGETKFERTLQDKIATAEDRVRQQSPKEDRKPEEQKNSSKSGGSLKRQEQVDRSSNGKTKVKVSGREKAIQEFMDSFESEFKISPTRLVEAMAELEDADLMLSPEMTAESVISQLGLNEEESDKAQAMYAGLLQKLQETPAVAQSLAVAPEMSLQPEGSFVRALSHLEKGMQKVKAAEDVSTKFWGNSEALVSQGDSETSEAVMLPPALAAALKRSETLGQSKIELETLPPHLRGQMSESLSPELMQKLIQKIEKAESAPEAQEGTAALLKELQAILPEHVRMPHEGSTDTSPAASGDSDSALMATLMGQHKGASQEQSDQSGQQSPEQSLAFMERDMGDKLRNLEIALKSLEGFQVERPTNTLGNQVGLGAAVPVIQVTQADPETNINEVMNQARVLIKDGGGEMKVQMNAEGLGNVHLKVHLQDGKVSLQMAADTHEAKKMIEHGLADLKSSLAAQKLSVENIKVDVVEEVRNQTQAENNTNLDYNQQRDQTRQFWNRFQDQFGGALNRREALFDTTATRGYGKERRDSLNPIETSVARKVDGKGSEINVVA